MQNDIFLTVTEATKMENLYLAPMTLTQLGELYDESKAHFARRMVEHSWFWGKIFVQCQTANGTRAMVGLVARS